MDKIVKPISVVDLLSGAAHRAGFDGMTKMET